MKNKLNLEKDHQILKPPDMAAINLIQAKYEIKTLKALHQLLKEKYTDTFPKLPAYQNFVLAMNKYSCLFLLRIILLVIRVGRPNLSKVKFIDSTPIPVCKVYRASRHKNYEDSIYQEKKVLLAGIMVLSYI